MQNARLIYGKDETQGVTSIEFVDGVATIFLNDGKTETKFADHWALYDRAVTQDAMKLQGTQHYLYAKKYTSMDVLRKDYGRYVYREGADGFVLWNTKEQYMVKNGLTYYKGLTPKDVSVLSFDIETTSLKPSDNEKILLISNTFRDRYGNIERRLFAYDDYKSTKEMVYAWAHFVREKNPDILCGHNIFGFDIPFIEYYVRGIPIGRDNSTLTISKKPREFRKEGSQTYTYHDCFVYGREIVDTMFLSYKYDAAARKYESYSLKTIINIEGLEKESRTFYDASQIRFKYKDSTEWAKIKEYAEHDADDALALFDLMIPSYFYFCQAVPKPLQEIINGNSGSQVNSWMLRAYLQDGHSIPKATERYKYKGAMTFDIPGIYNNIKKVDVQSMHPNIILENSIYNKTKDPNAYFLSMVRHFTEERIRYKELAASSGDKKYKDRSEAMKIFINSAYGFLGTAGLSYNSIDHAKLITRISRKILVKGLRWCKDNGFKYINGDTDSFCYANSFDFEQEIRSLNSRFSNNIQWKNDGEYDKVVIVGSKNYVLKKGDKLTVKGSALKASTKSLALRQFINNCIDKILRGGQDDILDLYNDCARDILSINKDTIKYWASKKTVTKAILNPKRANESRPAEAIAGKGLQEGDKFYVYFRTSTDVCSVEEFDGVYDKKRLLKNLYDTINIFAPVLDLTHFKNYSLKKNEGLL